MVLWFVAAVCFYVLPRYFDLITFFLPKLQYPESASLKVLLFVRILARSCVASLILGEAQSVCEPKVRRSVQRLAFSANADIVCAPLGSASFKRPLFGVFLYLAIDGWSSDQKRSGIS